MSVLEAYRCEREAPGVYRSAWGLGLSVVVLSELPRTRDTLLKTTERGPHRDDLELVLNGRPAKQFASEGQQRCLVIALRLAQAAYFRAKGGVTPVLLCDDVLGELDPTRRERFWASLEGEPQVIATGTSLPADAAGWQVLTVEAGRVL